MEILHDLQLDFLMATGLHFLLAPDFVENDFVVVDGRFVVEERGAHLALVLGGALPGEAVAVGGVREEAFCVYVHAVPIQAAETAPLLLAHAGLGVALYCELLMPG